MASAAHKQKGDLRSSKSSIAATFGKNLRACRLRAKLSQEELSFQTSLHRTEISLLERGRREPRLGTIIKLASTLSVPLGTLCSGIDWRPAKSEK